MASRGGSRRRADDKAEFELIDRWGRLSPRDRASHWPVLTAAERVVLRQAFDKSEVFP